MVFDLDETLIHTFFDQNSKAHFNVKLPITPQTADLQQDFSLEYIPLFISVRNGAEQSLKRLQRQYELILWTASPQEYAEAVLKVTGLRQYFKYFLYRQDNSVNARGQ